MLRLSFLIFFLIGFSVTAFTQQANALPDSGFENEDPIYDDKWLDSLELKKYLSDFKKEGGNVVAGGYTGSIFHENIDSVKVDIYLDNALIESVYSENGLFGYSLSSNAKNSLLELRFSHPDYHSYDTSTVIKDDQLLVFHIEMTPRYNILLRGRVYAGNLPLEGVDVSVNHLDNVFKIQTEGCYYDNEDYWNCLYNGMFKLLITADDPGDSIRIDLRKDGMKPYSMGMTFNEYTGDILNIKMKYSSKLPVIPQNNVNLKLAFPFASNGDDWYVDLSYYRILNIQKLKRLALGIDANMLVSTIIVEHETFPGIYTEKDSTYINGFVGPSALFWILRPDRRMFSTYVGSTFAIKMNNPEFDIQAFFGSRIFLDINKALSLEFRYLGYTTNVSYYRFNMYGNAESYTIKETFNKFQLNLGFQIVF